jgi:hypothetical protein
MIFVPHSRNASKPQGFVTGIVLLSLLLLSSLYDSAQQEHECNEYIQNASLVEVTPLYTSLRSLQAFVYPNEEVSAIVSGSHNIVLALPELRVPAN